MKIPNAHQIRLLDAFTIENEPIPSIDLMERASSTFVSWFLSLHFSIDKPIQIFCGMGNNGGDGLAIARLLQESFYSVEVFICEIQNSPSDDFSHNLKRLPTRNGVKVSSIKSGSNFPQIAKNAILIDAIFGSGLSRILSGYWATLISHINLYKQVCIAIDIPSGLFMDKHTNGISIQADYTFSFQFPKLCFLLAENEKSVGKWTAASIGLHPKGISNIKCNYHYLSKTAISLYLKKRPTFSHKGTYGNGLLLSGSYGMMGAAILAAKAGMRSGVGLFTIHIPKIGYTVLQSSIPECIISIDKHEHYISDLPDIDNYNAIGIGPGIGTNPTTITLVKKLLESSTVPLVLDADAINIISANKAFLNLIPAKSIMTPHPGEFTRLAGPFKNDFDRLEKQISLSKQFNLYILLKGAYTSISTPEGEVYFNSSGNPGMATAGSGDVLTGLITGLLAQRYNSFESCLIGAFVHGLAGDLCLSQESMESLIASDIISNIGQAFKSITES